VIAPVFGAVLLGFVLYRRGIFDGHTSDGLAKYVYYVAIPALLFRSLAHADLPAHLPLNLIAAFYVPSLIMFSLGGVITGRLFGWDRASRGIGGLGACYSNLVMLGLPLATSAFGPAAAVPLFSIMALQSTLLFPVATYWIEVYGARGTGAAVSPLRSMGNLLLNPVITSLAAGVLVNHFSIAPTGAIDVLLEKLAQSAAGCALVSLGVSLAQYRLSGGLSEALLLIAVKNVLHPLATFIACSLFAVRPDWARVAVLLAAMPSGVNGYIFAKRYGLQEAVISKTIVLSTLATGIVTWVILQWYLVR